MTGTITDAATRARRAARAPVRSRRRARYAAGGCAGPADAGKRSAVVGSSPRRSRSRVRRAPDRCRYGVRGEPLRGARRAGPACGNPAGALAMRKAFIDYQSAAEERRQLAADVGELIREFIEELVAAGWSEEQANHANVHELAATSKAEHARITGPAVAPPSRAARAPGARRSPQSAKRIAPRRT